MNILAASGLSVFISSFLTAIFVYANNPKKHVNIAWGLFCLTVSFWGLGLFLAFITNEKEPALFWGRFLNLSAIFIPVFFLHFVIAFLDLFKQRKRILFFSYFIALIYFFISIIRPELFIKDVRLMGSFIFYPEAGRLYYLFPILYSILVIFGIKELVEHYKQTHGEKRGQLIYLFLGMVIGFSGGATTFPYVFGLPIYPFGTWGVIFYVILVAYAITKHRLMDIRVVISRLAAEIMTAIFLSGIYLGLGWLYLVLFPNHIGWLFLTGTIVYGVIVGETFQKIRLFLQTTSDKLFLRGGYDYTGALAGAGEQITKTLSMENILQTFKHTFADVMEVANPRIYIGDEELKPFGDFQSITQKDNDLIIPCRLEGRLIAVIVLGPKLSEDYYTPEDLRLLQALASQAAVAIDHTRTYEQVRAAFDANQKKLYDTERLLARSEKIASMASLIQEYNHEIRTPLAIMSSKIYTLPDDPKGIADFKELKAYLLKQINRASDIIDSTLRLSQPKQRKEIALDLNKIIEEALAIYQPIGIKVIKEFGSLPPIVGDADDLRLVFINLVKNAGEAMPERGRITIKTYPTTEENSPVVVASVADTGQGIAKENLEKIFEPFFSTHVTKGRGLGLSIVFRIIREHLGRIEVKSELGQGAVFTITLPAKG